MTRSIITLTLAGALLALSGCASVNSQFFPKAEEPKWSSLCKDEPSTSDSCARRAYERAMTYCVAKQAEYQDFDLATNQFRFGIGTVGAIAGAVVAPLASGTAAKAWSGLSGATNGIQTGYDQAFSAARETNRRAALASLIDDFGAHYAPDDTPDRRYAMSVLYASKCAASAGAADAKAIKAIMTTE